MLSSKIGRLLFIGNDDNFKSVSSVVSNDNYTLDRASIGALKKRIYDAIIGDTDKIGLNELEQIHNLSKETGILIIVAEPNVDKIVNYIKKGTNNLTTEVNSPDFLIKLNGVIKETKENRKIISRLNKIDEIIKMSNPFWQFDHAIAQVVDTIIIDIETHEIVYCKSSVERMFGYINGELSGKSIHELVPPELREKHAKWINEFSKRPRDRSMGARGAEIVGWHKSGYEFPVQIGLSPIVIDDKPFVVATIIDLSAK